jgi:CBS domain-containing protein
MKTVEQILRGKADVIWSTTPDTSVFDALQLMAEKNVGALLVLEGGTLTGIFSERDYARKVILKGKSSRDIPVSEIMTTKVFHVLPSHTIEECMQVMTDKHIRHLPVIDAEKLIGLISIGDVVKGIISEQRETINHLEEYITGRR